MVYLPIHLLKPGMVLAKDVPSFNFLIPLIPTGKRLTIFTIDKIVQRGVQGAYVEVLGPAFAGIEARDFIEPGYKQQLLADVKKEFDSYVKKTTTAPAANSYKNFARMASSLVLQVMSQDQLLFDVIDLRDYDNYTYSHSMCVAILSVLIGINLDLPSSDLVNLATCGLLHDIGKLDIPLEIVNKPSDLTAAEMDIMREHPDRAVRHLQETPMYSFKVIAGIRSHHERYDGDGYPKGKRGDEIPLYGRILALADVFDALHSNRPYRKAWSGGQIIEYMMGNSGSHFDPSLMGAFLHSVAVYPVGTIVRLSNGSFGVVVKNTPGFTLRPLVRLFTDSGRMIRDVNLAEECLNVTISETIDSENTALNTAFLALAEQLAADVDKAASH